MFKVLTKEPGRFQISLCDADWPLIIKTPFTRAKKLGTARQVFGTAPRLPPGGSLDTPEILSTGATLHVGPIRLHVENWECRALKSSARCQKFGVPCRFFERV